jgi:hypothetical protein
MKQWFIVDFSDYNLDYPVYKKIRFPYLFFYFVRGERGTIGPSEYSLQRTSHYYLIIPSPMPISSLDVVTTRILIGDVENRRWD